MHEYAEQVRVEQYREKESEYGTVKVCIVVDVIPSATCHVLAIDQVQRPEQDAGYGYSRKQ